MAWLTKLRCYVEAGHSEFFQDDARESTHVFAVCRSLGVWAFGSKIPPSGSSQSCFSPSLEIFTHWHLWAFRRWACATHSGGILFSGVAGSFALCQGEVILECQPMGNVTTFLFWSPQLDQFPAVWFFIILGRSPQFPGWWQFTTICSSSRWMSFPQNRSSQCVNVHAYDTGSIQILGKMPNCKGLTFCWQQEHVPHLHCGLRLHLSFSRNQMCWYGEMTFLHLRFPKLVSARRENFNQQFFSLMTLPTWAGINDFPKAMEESWIT